MGQTHSSTSAWAPKTSVLKDEIEALLSKADEIDKREDEHFGKDQAALDIPEDGVCLGHNFLKLYRALFSVPALAGA